MIHAGALAKIKKVSERPPGYLGIQDIIAFSDKAFQVKFYRWILWVPRKAVVRWGTGTLKEYAVARWAIDSSKIHPSAQGVGS